MRKKITMLLASLFVTMGTAWAYQLSYDKALWTVPAASHEKVQEVPAEVFTAYNTNYAELDELSADKVGVYAESVDATGGDVTVLLQYVSGNGSNIRLDICGVDLVAADGSVKYSDYHFGWAGGSPSNNTYTLAGVEKGSYTLRVFVASQKEDFTNEANNSRGNMTVTRALQSIRLTTDPKAPVLYTIKNVRGNAYAGWNGNGGRMSLSATVTGLNQLFYFTAGTTEGTYKIHNYVTSNKCAGVGSWDAEGIDWYIQTSGCTSHIGFAISKEEKLTTDGEEAWNDFQNVHTSVNWYGGNDAGSVWAIEVFEGDTQVKMSTEESKYLYFIKNVRSGKFVDYVQGQALRQIDSKELGSYWYFVEATGVENVPAGFKACYVYNAASELPLENHTNGNMAAPDAQPYPAKIYFVGLHENTYKGYVIYPQGSTNGWNDFASQGVTDWAWDSDGSIWSIFAADKTAANFVSEATTAKNNALNTIAVCEYADYYTYSDEAIATAKAAIEALGDVNVLATAVNAPATINAAMEALRTTEKGAAAPVAGQYIQLKNKQYGTYLKGGDTGLNAENSASDLATIWLVEAGTDTNVKLKNVSTGKYIGEIRKSANVAMVDAANAKEFAFANQTDVYAVFKETTGGDHAYGHIAGHNVLVGWNTNADATQWAVAQISVEPYVAALQEALENADLTVGTAVGQKTVNSEEFATAKAAAEGLLAAEEKTIKALVDAKEALNAVVAAGTVNLPVAGKYYQIKSANPDFFAKQGVEMAIYSNAADGLLSWKALDAADKSFYWTITPNAEGKFVIQNVKDSKYVPALADDKYLMVEDEASAAAFTLSWLTVNQFNITGNGTMHMRGHGEGAGKGADICSWDAGINSASAWTIVEVENPDLAIAKAALAAKVAELEAYVANATGAIGYYKAVATDELEAAIAEAEAELNGGSSDAAVYEAAMATLTAASEGLDMNIVLPETGKFYRIKNNAGNAYLNAGTTGRSQFAAGVNELASSIFYYNGKLLSYANGMYLANAGGFLNYGETVGEGAEIAFEASKEFGKLQIKFGDNRYFYSNGASESNAGGNAGMTADGNYRFTIEEVTWLPVSMNTELGYSTLYSPVALSTYEYASTTAHRVEAYVGKVEGNEFVMTRIDAEDGVIPANTPVVLKYVASYDEAKKAVYLQVSDSEKAAVAEENNDLRGSYADVYVTEASYILSMKESVPGFYKAAMNKLEGTAFKNNGFKAYLPAPANTSAVMFTLGRGGEDEDATGIDQLINNGEVVIYDLSGRRVEKMEKGIYIVNGKKVVK